MTPLCDGRCNGHATLPVSVDDVVASGHDRGLEIVGPGPTRTWLLVNADGSVECCPGHEPWIHDGSVLGLRGVA